MMEPAFLVFLIVLGLCGGFVSGLLGLGGAIFMIPLLLYVPPALGIGRLDMKDVAAISMVQVLSASLSGVIVHYRNRFVSRSLLVYMGLFGAFGNLGGAVLSKYAHSDMLLAVFATMALAAAAIMFVPKREHGDSLEPDKIRYNKTLASAISTCVGIFGGMVGAPGAFIYIPVMIYLLDIPTRIAIGSMLGIVFMGAVFGTAGKMLTGQIIWPYALALVAGTVPGAQIGGRFSKKIDAGRLRIIIAVIFAIAGIRIWYQVFTGK